VILKIFEPECAMRQHWKHRLRGPLAGLLTVPPERPCWRLRPDSNLQHGGGGGGARRYRLGGYTQPRQGVLGIWWPKTRRSTRARR